MSALWGPLVSALRAEAAATLRAGIYSTRQAGLMFTLQAGFESALWAGFVPQVGPDSFPHFGPNSCPHFGPDSTPCFGPNRIKHFVFGFRKISQHKIVIVPTCPLPLYFKFQMLPHSQEKMRCVEQSQTEDQDPGIIKRELQFASHLGPRRSNNPYMNNSIRQRY